MPKLVLVGVPFLHGIVTSRLWNLAAGVILQMTTRSMEALLVVPFAIILLQRAAARENHPVQTRILLNASSSIVSVGSAGAVSTENTSRAAHSAGMA